MSAGLAIALAVVGILVGVVSAYRRGWLDELAGRLTDLVLAFPALIFALLLLAAFGTSIELVVVAIVVEVAATVFLVAFLVANGTGLQKIRTSSRWAA